MRERVAPTGSPRDPVHADANAGLGQTKPTTSEAPGNKKSGPSSAVIIAAVCVGLGIPIVAGISVWFWCMRKHRQRIEYEESRKRRFQTVIH